jgi:hypothetical protein
MRIWFVSVVLEVTPVLEPDDVSVREAENIFCKIVITLTYKFMLSGINAYHNLRTE